MFISSPTMTVHQLCSRAIKSNLYGEHPQISTQLNREFQKFSQKFQMACDLRAYNTTFDRPHVYLAWAYSVKNHCQQRST